MTKYCNHGEYRNNHCAVMACRNYVNKCPKHGIVGSDKEVCNNKRK